MDAFDLMAAGRFEDVISVLHLRLAANPDDHAAASGLAQAYMGLGRYEEAIPWEWQVHERSKMRNPDSPGELLSLSCAYWCLEDRGRAIELVHKLCESILDGTVSMAPDQAGGATFGLILHYMGVTARDNASRDYSLAYLRKLNLKYDKRPALFRYPVQTVKQLLGEVTFEDALEGATKERSLAAAYRAADGNRSIKLALGVALFHEGVMHRVEGDEAACAGRMKQVADLGYQTEAFRWYLSRHEVAKSK